MIQEQDQFTRTVSPFTPAAKPAVGVYLTEKAHLRETESVSVPAGSSDALAGGSPGQGLRDSPLIEVYNDPTHALCGEPQSLRPEAFASLSKNC